MRNSSSLNRSGARIIYFDYNATTPIDPQVLEAMRPCFEENWGNPSSVHTLGRRARALLDEAHERAAGALGCKPGEIVFTSGGTESVNMAVLGTARKLKSKGCHIICSSVEHHAVLHAFGYLEKYDGFQVTRLPVDRDGLVDPEMLKRHIRKDTVLVSVQAANNEVGTVQSVAELGLICSGQSIVFHTDAVQWFGKMPFESIHQFHADLVSICAHKIHGPKGAGALFIRSPLHIDPILFGGAHENERRAGTENLAGIIGMVECLERFIRKPVFKSDNLLLLTNSIVSGIEQLHGVVTLSPKQRLPNTISFAVQQADSISLLAGLDMEGICASSGSACSAGSLEPSHVVRAMRHDDSLANALVRFSLGRGSTKEEVLCLTSVFPEIVDRVQTFQQRSSKL